MQFSQGNSGNESLVWPQVFCCYYNHPRTPLRVYVLNTHSVLPVCFRWEARRQLNENQTTIWDNSASGWYSPAKDHFKRWWTKAWNVFEHRAELPGYTLVLGSGKRHKSYRLRLGENRVVLWPSSRNIRAGFELLSHGQATLSPWCVRPALWGRACLLGNWRKGNGTLLLDVLQSTPRRRAEFKKFQCARGWPRSGYRSREWPIRGQNAGTRLWSFHLVDEIPAENMANSRGASLFQSCKGKALPCTSRFL